MKEQKPAFPQFNAMADSGMSKRFYAACTALQGLLSSGDIRLSEKSVYESISEMAYKFADELIKQENE